MSICREDIFKEQYLKYMPDVQRFIISRGALADQSIDIVQESFLRMWQKCQELQVHQVKSFLFTTASRLVIDIYRKTETGKKYQLSLELKDNREDGQFSLEMDEFKRALESAIATMTEGSREVFMLHRFEDMKYREIAEHLDISVKAVEKRMHKALKHLASCKIPKLK